MSTLPKFNKAGDMLQAGETGLFVFSDGRDFMFYPEDDSGSVGFWAENPAPDAQRVVVFFETHFPSAGIRMVQLFTGWHDGVVGPAEDGRYTVRLGGVQLAGFSDSSWPDFAGAGQNSVVYVSKPID